MWIESSAHAVADLEAISKYIEQDRDVEAANRVARAIYEAVQGLRTMPYRGRSGRIENTRELVMPRFRYLVIYRVFEARVLILNIVHGARRWP
jgi:toxin ParE1/3/4